ncbi:hypothetical protein P9112_012845 [Eukaryota sp. TZLM1-RC]
MALVYETHTSLKGFVSDTINISSFRPPNPPLYLLGPIFKANTIPPFMTVFTALDPSLYSERHSPYTPIDPLLTISDCTTIRPVWTAYAAANRFLNFLPAIRGKVDNAMKSFKLGASTGVFLLLLPILNVAQSLFVLYKCRPIKDPLAMSFLWSYLEDQEQFNRAAKNVLMSFLPVPISASSLGLLMESFACLMLLFHLQHCKKSHNIASGVPFLTLTSLESFLNCKMREVGVFEFRQLGTCNKPSMPSYCDAQSQVEFPFNQWRLSATQLEVLTEKGVFEDYAVFYSRLWSAFKERTLLLMPVNNPGINAILPMIH